MILWQKTEAKEPARKGLTKRLAERQGQNTTIEKNPKYYAPNAEQCFAGFQQALKERANQQKCLTGQMQGIIAQNAPESL